MPGGEPNSIKRKVLPSEVAAKRIEAAGDDVMARLVAVNKELQTLPHNHNDVRRLSQTAIGLLVDVVTKHIQEHDKNDK